MTLETDTDPALAPARPAGASPRLTGIDGLRGLAALIVLVFHTHGQAGGPEWRIHGVNVTRPVHDGWAAVNLFLVLSGFCLYWPYASRPGQPWRAWRAGDYAVRRSVRILPTYYASLIFVSALSLCPALRANDPSSRPQGWLDVASHAVLLNAWFPRYISSWNSVTWSLSLEFTWYAAFPLALLLFRRVGPDRGFAVLAGAAIAYRTALYFALGPSAQHPLEVGLVWRVFVVGRLFEFGIGMYVAAWVAQGRRVPAWACRGGLLVVLGLLVAAREAEPVDTLLPVRDVLYGLASAVLILLVAAPVDNLARTIFSHKAIVWVGEFSYTLYLFHLGLVAAAAVGLKRLGYSGMPLFGLLLATFPPIIFASWAMYLVVERPFARWRPRRPAVPQADALQLALA